MTTAAATPLISCLMVTLPVPERLAFLKRSVDDFCRQTWPHKELVVMLDRGTDSATDAVRAHILSLGRNDIHVLAPGSPGSVGQLRNLSVDTASGVLVCQWDDDDRYHPQRLELQARFLLEHDLEAVYLQEVMQYFPHQGTMFWTNWHAAPTPGHPGTLMARRAAMPRYPTDDTRARPDEDLIVARALIARGRVGYLPRSAPLYVYVSHGANSWNNGHHRMLADKLGISRALLRRREQEIRDGLAAYDFGEASITIEGSNGEAFVL